jgi:hypothetical protein
MARSITTSPSRSLPKRVAAGLAGVALAAVLAGCAGPYTSGAGTSGNDTSGSTGSRDATAAITDPGTDPGEVVLVCDSGIVTGPDGVETSSSVVSRVPADSPVPEGCHLG